MGPLADADSGRGQQSWGTVPVWGGGQPSVILGFHLSEIPENAPTRSASPSCYWDFVCHVGPHHLSQVWTCQGGSPRQRPGLGHGKWPPTTIPAATTFLGLLRPGWNFLGAFLQISTCTGFPRERHFPGVDCCR